MCVGLIGSQQVEVIKPEFLPCQIYKKKKKNPVVRAITVRGGDKLSKKAKGDPEAWRENERASHSNCINVTFSERCLTKTSVHYQ